MRSCEQSQSIRSTMKRWRQAWYSVRLQTNIRKLTLNYRCPYYSLTPTSFAVWSNLRLIHTWASTSLFRFHSAESLVKFKPFVRIRTNSSLRQTYDQHSVEYTRLLPETRMIPIATSLLDSVVSARSVTCTCLGQ